MTFDKSLAEAIPTFVNARARDPSEPTRRPTNQATGHDIIAQYSDSSRGHNIGRGGQQVSIAFTIAAGIIGSKEIDTAK